MNGNTLMDDVFQYLSACSYFADVPIIKIEDDADGQTGVDYLLGTQTKSGKCGVLVTVLPIVAGPISDAGPELDLDVYLIAQENQQVNNTGKDAHSIAVEVVRHLNGFFVGGYGAFYLDKSKNSIMPNGEFLPIITREINLKNSIRLSQVSRCGLPTISETSLTVTLTGQDSIYYTTDESFPVSTNSNAVLYSAPFTVTSGTIVRWAAYSITKEPSAIGRATIT